MRFGQFSSDEIVAGLIGTSTGLAVAALVYMFARANPWPRPFRLRFALLHLIAIPSFSLLWQVASGLLAVVVTGEPLLPRLRYRLDEHLFIGFFFYNIVAGLAYAIEGSRRAGRAEALSARMQLAALRAQLHPHFLFNALHTVVQLIPVDPKRAIEAAELVADLLRRTIEEKRDEVPLAEEAAFVSRYLAVERIRFGERLVIREEIPAALRDEPIPAFSMQTLVENAVRHGAAPSVEPTRIEIVAASRGTELQLSVKNSNAAPGRNGEAGTGTGLARLRERLTVLYGSAARLDCGPDGKGGFEAVIAVPLRGASSE
jgi:two-component system LytT family sensor kinase